MSTFFTNSRNKYLGIHERVHNYCCSHTCRIRGWIQRESPPPPKFFKNALAGSCGRRTGFHCLYFLFMEVFTRLWPNPTNNLLQNQYQPRLSSKMDYVIDIPTPSSPPYLILIDMFSSENLLKRLMWVKLNYIFSYSGKTSSHSLFFFYILAPSSSILEKFY